MLYCDPDHPLVTTGLPRILSEEWTWHHLFPQSGFPVARVHWTPELTAMVEAQAQKDAHVRDYELYWIAKVLPSPVLKAQFLKLLEGDGHFKFWPALALVEVWGGADKEVRDALLPFLDADPKEIAMVAEALPAVVDDKQRCRAALLRSLRGKPKRVDFLMTGLRTLGVAADDDEAFEACWASREGMDAPLYDDSWRAHMIHTFPSRPQTRDLAVQEMVRHDGAVGAISESYASDVQMTGDLLKVICPLATGARSILVTALEGAAPSNITAARLLDVVREDTDGAVGSEATIGWVEAHAARGTLGSNHVNELAAGLDAVGPEYHHRRAAALVGLAIAGQMDRFVQKTDYKSEPLSIAVAGAFVRDDDRYLKRLVPRWGQLINAMGTEETVFERLEIAPESALALIEPGVPNGRKLFELLIREGAFIPAYFQTCTDQRDRSVRAEGRADAWPHHPIADAVRDQRVLGWAGGG